MASEILTDAAIKAAKPGQKSARMFDGKGLHLEVRPNGGKWWRLKYRYGGKEKLLSMGTYPDTSLKEARGRRDKAGALLASGVDRCGRRRLLRGLRLLGSREGVKEEIHAIRSRRGQHHPLVMQVVAAARP